jgi:hypothetical protein
VLVVIVRFIHLTHDLIEHCVVAVAIQFMVDLEIDFHSAFVGNIHLHGHLLSLSDDICCCVNYGIQEFFDELLAKIQVVVLRIQKTSAITTPTNFESFPDEILNYVRHHVILLLKSYLNELFVDTDYNYVLYIQYTMSTDLIKKFVSSFQSAFQGPTFQKFQSKLTSREFVAPLVYSLILMFAFALTYALIGYKNIFETTDENRKRNVQNSIMASVMLQSNAMGQVVPINELGAWLMTVQTAMGWLFFLCLIYVIV